MILGGARSGLLAGIRYDRLVPYLGSVATGHNLIPGYGGADSASSGSNCRSVHTAREDIMSSMQLLDFNWYVNNAGTGLTYQETNPGAAVTFTHSVEYPIGNPNRVQVTWSGASSVSVADGGQAISDVIPIIIPKGGTFYIYTFRHSASAVIPYGLDICLSEGEKAVYGNASTPDMTMSGSFSDDGNAAYYRPIILGMTNRPSLALIGDSRTTGDGEMTFVGAAGTLAYSSAGELARSLEPQLATLNLGVSGDAPQLWLASNTKRLALATTYCSAIAIEFGINHLFGGGSSASVISDLQSMIALFPGKKVYVTTLSPVTIGTVSGSNTWDSTREANRVSVNNAIRSGLAGAAGYFEVADIMETARNSGVWNTGYTTDGIHGNVTGIAALVASGAVSPIVYTP